MKFNSDSYSIIEFEKMINKKFADGYFLFKLNEEYVNQLYLISFNGVKIENEQKLNLFLSDERINKSRVDEAFNIIETSITMLKHFNIIK